MDVNTVEQRPIARLGLNEVGYAQLSLSQPTASDPYQRNAVAGAFILIDRQTNNTVGAGMILKPRDDRGQAGRWVQVPAAKLKSRESLVSAEERGAIWAEAGESAARRTHRQRQEPKRIRSGTSAMGRGTGVTTMESEPPAPATPVGLYGVSSENDHAKQFRPFWSGRGRLVSWRRE